jgi:hypothetical protein
MPRSRRGWLLFLVAATVVTLMAAAIFAFAPMVFYPAAMSIWGVPNDSDRHQLNVIVEAVTNAHHFAHNSVSDPLMAPVFGDPGSKGLLTNQ